MESNKRIGFSKSFTNEMFRKVTNPLKLKVRKGALEALHRAADDFVVDILSKAKDEDGFLEEKGAVEAIVAPKRGWVWEEAEEANEVEEVEEEEEKEVCDAAEAA